jgi:ribosomal protein L22
MMEVRAITKYVGISPQKTRWVIDQVRGMQAERRWQSCAL